MVEPGFAFESLEVAVATTNSCFYKFDIELAKKTIGLKAFTRKRIKKYFNYLKFGKVPSDKNADQLRTWKKKMRSYKLPDGQNNFTDGSNATIFYKMRELGEKRTEEKTRKEERLVEWRVVVPRDQVLNVLYKAHSEDSHFGRCSCEELLVAQYWKNKKADIITFISMCPTCARGNPTKSVPPHQPIIEMDIRERIQFDFFQVPDNQRDAKTRDRYVLVCVDSFSKRIWLKAFPTKEAEPVARFLVETFKADMVVTFHSDNGGEFVAEVVRVAISEMGAKFVHGLPYKPTSQGQVERANQTIKKRVFDVITVNPNWSSRLQEIEREYNYQKHTTTRFAPMELENEESTRRLITIPGMIMPPIKQLSLEEKKKMARHNISVAAQEAKQKRDQRIRKFHYKVGELVLVRKRRPEKGTKRGGGYHWVAKVVSVMPSGSSYKLQWMGPLESFRTATAGTQGGPELSDLVGKVSSTAWQDTHLKKYICAENYEFQKNGGVEVQQVNDDDSDPVASVPQILSLENTTTTTTTTTAVTTTTKEPFTQEQLAFLWRWQSILVSQLSNVPHDHALSALNLENPFQCLFAPTSHSHSDLRSNPRSHSQSPSPSRARSRSRSRSHSPVHASSRSRSASPHSRARSRSRSPPRSLSPPSPRASLPQHTSKNSRFEAYLSTLRQNPHQQREPRRPKEPDRFGTWVNSKELTPKK